MGRGLSQLQKAILVMAQEGRIEKAQGAEGGRRLDVYTSEVYQVLYLHRCRHDLTPYQNRPLHPTGQLFASEEDPHYRSAKVAICRAFRRLEERGLAEGVRGLVQWSGVNLTASGLAEANRLNG